MRKLVLLALLIFAIPLTSLAWNRRGHQAASAIAYARLSQNDKEKAIAILKYHPWYNSEWRTEYQQSHPPNMSFENYAFIRAAAWPDDIRNNPAFHHRPWHYVNYPFRMPNNIDFDDPIGDGIMMTKIQDAMDSVKNDDAISQRENRAIMLSWLLHLLGDMHQPLHTVALVNSTYPEGDHGGNDFFVRKTPTSSVKTLHSFWDDVLGTSRTIQSSAALATDLRSQHPFSSSMDNGDYKDWAKDSARLAINHAYKFNGEAITGSSNRNQGTAVPVGYAANATSVSAKQVALAGYRIATELRSLL